MSGDSYSGEDAGFQGYGDSGGGGPSLDALTPGGGTDPFNPATMGNVPDALAPGGGNTLSPSSAPPTVSASTTDLTSDPGTTVTPRDDTKTDTSTDTPKTDTTPPKTDTKPPDTSTLSKRQDRLGQPGPRDRQRPSGGQAGGNQRDQIINLIRALTQRLNGGMGGMPGMPGGGYQSPYGGGGFGGMRRGFGGMGGGGLNAGQRALLRLNRGNAMAGARQAMYNAGIGNPAGDSRFAQMAQNIDNQIAATAANMMRQNFQDELAGNEQQLRFAQFQLGQNKDLNKSIEDTITEILKSGGGGQQSPGTYSGAENTG